MRIELMADCLGGVWANHATTVEDEDTGAAVPQAADRAGHQGRPVRGLRRRRRPIQEKTQGRVTPENWTHGSAEARQRWFLQGFKTGDLNQCDTFAVESVN